MILILLLIMWIINLNYLFVEIVQILRKLII